MKPIKPSLTLQKRRIMINMDLLMEIHFRVVDDEEIPMVVPTGLRVIPDDLGALKIFFHNMDEAEGAQVKGLTLISVIFSHEWEKGDLEILILMNLKHSNKRRQAKKSRIWTL